jgi:hypothetical protein
MRLPQRHNCRPEGGSGSLTLTVQTANSATGTFTFTLAPIGVSGATTAATITNGSFNITF